MGKGWQFLTTNPKGQHPLSGTSSWPVFFLIWRSQPKPSTLYCIIQNPPANAGDSRDMGSIPGLGRSPGNCGVENVNLLQCSCLENPRDRGAWLATIYRVAKSRTQLSTHTHTHTSNWPPPPFSFLLACGILVPWPGIKPVPSAVKVWSPNHGLLWNSPFYFFNFKE